MKRSRFTEEQIIGVLGEQEAGAKTADLCRRHGISSATCLSLEGEVRRHGRLGGEAAEGARRRERQAQAASGRCHSRRVCSEGPAGKKMVTPAAVREAVAHVLREHDVSERRACSIVGADRSTIRYRSRRNDDALLRGRLRELATERRRFGYRRLHVLLRQEGHVVNHKRTQRLYREEGLSVRRRRCRKRAVGTRAPMVAEARPNARWSLELASPAFGSFTTRWRPGSGSVCSTSSTT